MQAKNWTKLFESYKGRWVALEGDETTVISSGEKLADVIRIAADKGYIKPILTKVPKKNMVYRGLL